MRAAGLTVIVLEPLQVKAFARLHLRRAKNDKVDAGLITACTSLLDTDKKPPDPRLEKLTEQLTFVEPAKKTSGA